MFNGETQYKSQFSVVMLVIPRGYRREPRPHVLIVVAPSVGRAQALCADPTWTASGSNREFSGEAMAIHDNPWMDMIYLTW